MLDPEEQRAVEAVLRRFADRIDGVLFTGEGADGDLSRVPGLLAEAQALDLVADAMAGAPGYELGVWGTHCWAEGAARSLLALAHLGEACAGLAAAVHAQGLACLALARHNAGHPEGEAGWAPGRWLATACLPGYGIPLSARLGPEGSGLWLAGGGDRPTLSGTAHFLLAAGPPEMLVCFAQLLGREGTGQEWACVTVDARAGGVELADVGPRTGLRAARQLHLHCEGVAVSPEQVLCTGDAARRRLAQVLACDWLGQAAIALGVARRSLWDSRAYTAQRIQGGRIIEEHAGVQLLQGTAEYDVAVLEAILFRNAGEPLTTLEAVALLRWALAARLTVVEHAHRAVTHCLQTLGGYGYMEDYRLEKRLRDVSTLKSLHGAPDQLRLYLNELARGQRPDA
jgi:alkylation response protein AidB-like acyl-CoA dehydrogenase